jgi:hypothetical protein
MRRPCFVGTFRRLRDLPIPSLTNSSSAQKSCIMLYCVQVYTNGPRKSCRACHCCGVLFESIQGLHQLVLYSLDAVESLVPEIAAWRLFTDVMKAVKRSDLIDQFGLKSTFDTVPPEVQEKIYGAIEEVTKKMTVIEAEQMFMDCGIPCSRILTPWDCINDKNYKDRKTLFEFDCPHYGKHLATQPQPRLPAPRVELNGWLSLSDMKHSRF